MMTQLRRTAAMSEWFGIEVQMIGPEAAKEKWPLLRIDDLLGAADVRLYDASMSEWANDPSLPMETG